MIRPSVAGIFYPGEFHELENLISKSFHSKFGPGALPTKRNLKNEVLGVIVPHAGYLYSGPAAAWAYKELAEVKMPKTYVILAPDHNGIFEDIATTEEDFETPFGIVKVDNDFLDKLKEKCDFIKVSKIHDHAVEVQLPFLQFISRDNLNNLRIVPLIVPSDKNLKKLAEAIAEISEDISVIMSSDFTHFGLSYGYVPFKYSVKENVKELDFGAINHIVNLDAGGFIDYCRKNKVTICGRYAIAAGLMILEEIFARKGVLLKYYTSGDVSGDYKNFVSYASIKFV